MNMLKSFLIIVFLGYISTNCLAQKADKQCLKNTDNLENWIIDNFQPDTAKLNQICQRSCVFIKFKLLLNGKIGQLAFTKGIPVMITDEIINTMHKMESNTIIAKE